MTATCATPPMESSRGRIVQSAKVRRSNMEVLSDVRLTIITSPKIDDCGPKVGRRTVLGNDSETVKSFSETIWRAR